jgi:hypothetical protein
MTARSWALWIGAAGLVGLVWWAEGVRTAEPVGFQVKGIFDQEEVAKKTELPAAPEGIEPQARGPVHEAFAEVARAGFEPGPVVAKEPPELIEEMPPAEKPDGEDVTWICGYWAYDDDATDFLWVSGIWRTPPPDRQWVPGHWSKVDDGWQWVPGFWADAEEGDVTVLPAPPPAPPKDAPPPPAAPNAHAVYVPGVYVPQGEGYTWRPPCYVEPRPGWVYVPPHYCPCPTGYVFVDGYWDYALKDRGLLFAPAFISAQCRTQPNFVYTPSYVVHDQALISAMFVRTGGGYYFGDYFGASYTRVGYTSITSVRIGSGYDPLFSYYRYENRGVPNWEQGFVGLYASRGVGAFPPPPRTLVQQRALAVGFRSGNTSIGFSVVQQSMLLAPVGAVNPAVVPIQRQPPAAILAQQRQAVAVRQVALQRQQAQANLIAQARQQPGPRAGNPGPRGPQRLALSLPKRANRPSSARKDPPNKPDRDRPSQKVEGKGTPAPELKPVAQEPQPLAQPPAAEKHVLKVAPPQEPKPAAEAPRQADKDRDPKPGVQKPKQQDQGPKPEPARQPKPDGPKPNAGKQPRAQEPKPQQPLVKPQGNPAPRPKGPEVRPPQNRPDPQPARPQKQEPRKPEPKKPQPKKPQPKKPR